METTFLVIFTLFLFLQTFALATAPRSCLFKRYMYRERTRIKSSVNMDRSCEWHGVGCHRRSGHVVKLDLRSSSYLVGQNFYYGKLLGGELSQSLLNLKHLLYLDLSLNHFSGHIPEFPGSFKRLEYLNLSQSGFSGVVPHHLGNLSSLQYLDLAYCNFFVKDDLRWVSLLSSLKHLDLSGINIGNHTDWFHPVNMLPSLVTLNLAWCDINIHSIKFINFTSLNSLDLSSNRIDSTIPVWLSNLIGLIHLHLQYNHFHGQIPDSIGTLSSLASIDHSLNSFYTLMPDLFWNLSSLVHLDLSANMFHGLFPPDVKLCNLSVLNLSDNMFAGDLSIFFGNMSSDCRLNSLKDLNLEWNHFNGNIPNKLGEFNKLEHLILSGNTLSGPIPPSLGGISSLSELVLYDNQLNGSIPESFGLLSRLETLYLNKNRLSGNFPTSLGQLSNLETLTVSFNSLVGVVSQIHYAKLENLTNLWLSYNSLTLNVSSRWVPRFQLQKLHAGSCNVGPQFPNWLQTQATLQILILSNSSIRDRIPEWFENILSYIYILDLSHNQICGNLPRFHGFSSNLLSNKFEGPFISFSSFEDLKDNLFMGHAPQTDEMNQSPALINLSKNRFTGSVPADICKVLIIKVLDLSQNKLSGRLPQSLASLNFLSYLNLSFNNLSGPVPVGNQLQTLDNASKYEGNNGLCGPPLSRSCKEHASPYHHVGGDEGQDDTDTEGSWFYAGMGPGFAIGFIGLLGSLRFIKSWRLAYIEILENVCGWLMVSILLNLALLRRKFS